MRKAIRNINQTGVIISKSRTIDTIRKYSILHNSMCERLYDLGFMSSPLYFDSVDFWTTFLSTYPDITKEFLNERTGEMNYSLPVIQYIAHRTEDRDIKLALDAVANVLKAEKAHLIKPVRLAISIILNLDHVLVEPTTAHKN